MDREIKIPVTFLLGTETDPVQVSYFSHLVAMCMFLIPVEVWVHPCFSIVPSRSKSFWSPRGPGFTRKSGRGTMPSLPLFSC